MTEIQRMPFIKPVNIRHLLGEMIVAGQRLGASDDVAVVEQWNEIPLPVREWLLEKTKASLPKLIEDTDKQAADRKVKIQHVLDELNALMTLTGEPVSVGVTSPFEDPSQLPPENQNN